MDKKNIIKYVEENSIADEAGINQGDELLSINKNKIIDIFDYRYLIAEEYLLVEIKKNNGEIWEIEVEKDEYEDLGIEFDNDLIDCEKSCKNKCIFCFIDQLPKGMRKTMYFKDDDSRLSFLTGNYVTLTNITDDELQRVIKYRLSPINISVHATNPDIRMRILKNPKAGDVISKIKKLIINNIKINCQIVLLRGINDKLELNRTINELANYYPQMQSISVVPVGLTKFRDHLENLIPFDKEAAIEVIKEVSKLQMEFFDKFGSRIVYLADEFYLLTDISLPKYEEYEDFPQIENGVGLFAKFAAEFNEELELINTKKTKILKDFKITIVTGSLIFNKFQKLIAKLNSKLTGINVNLEKIVNDFFGHSITVTGLITGSDIIKQLKDKDIGKYLLICNNMLKADEDIFLDDIKISDIEEALQIKVLVVNNDGKDLIKNIINIVQK